MRQNSIVQEFSEGVMKFTDKFSHFLPDNHAHNHCIGCKLRIFSGRINFLTLSLQVSLSMTRVAYTNRDGQDVTFSQLANNGINDYLDYLTKNKSMEFVSLVSKNKNHQNSLPSVQRKSFQNLRVLN